MIEVYTDGATSGNPGPSGAGIVIKNNNKMYEFSFPLEDLSNHEAEFYAVLKALELCQEKFPGEILSFRSDSKIVVDTIEKNHTKNKVFLPLLQQIQELAKDFPYFFIKWIPQKQNFNADRLAKEAIHKEKSEVEGDKMNKKSIILIGFMGVGKTTIGKELAIRLQRGFMDIDEEIEKNYQMKTVDIFKKHGEEEFRRTEKELIKNACAAEGKVISVGGGAFMQAETRNLCMENAIVLFLDLSWEHWKDRLSILVDSRPILQGKNSDEIKELYLNRQPIYKEHHIKVKIDDLNIQEAVEEITSELKRVK